MPLIPIKTITNLRIMRLFNLIILRKLFFSCLTFFLSTLLDCLCFSVDSTCLPKSPGCPCPGGLLQPLVLSGTKCSSSQGCSLIPIKQLLPFWSLEGLWRSFTDQPAAAADMGEEVAQAEDRGFKGAPHMGLISEDKMSFHHCQISPRLWTQILTQNSVNSVTPYTSLCMCTPVFCPNSKIPPVFSGVKVSLWSEQGRTVNITPSEHPPWEPSHALKLLPCSPLKWEVKRAKLLQLS